MAFITKVALSENSQPEVFLDSMQKKFPELQITGSNQGMKIWLEKISLVPSYLQTDHSSLLVSTPFLPAQEDLQLHADIITGIQNSDPEAIFSNSEGFVIQYPDEHYTEERMEQWFLSETEKFFNLIKNEEDFLIPLIHRPFHAGTNTRSLWWKKFRLSHESAKDELIHTLRLLQYPGIPEAPAFKVNQGNSSVQMVVFDNRSPLLLPPCPRIGFFNSVKKDLVSIPGAELRKILPEEWTMLDEHFCLASILNDQDFAILMAKAEEVEKEHH
jgi:hypothetical protein